MVYIDVTGYALSPFRTMFYHAQYFDAVDRMTAKSVKIAATSWLAETGFTWSSLILGRLDRNCRAEVRMSYLVIVMRCFDIVFVAEM